jgi:hypothetical protein
MTARRAANSDQQAAVAGTVPPAMAWSEFATLVSAQWSELLSRQDVAESDVQAFLERRPCLVPYASDDLGGVPRGHHGPLHGAVLRKPRLLGEGLLVPDFMRVTRDSGGIHVHLIEIESPSKPYFRKGGQLRAEFTQAMGQLSDWRAWLADPRNELSFAERLQVPPEWRRPMDVDLTLVYGRRAEVVAHPRGRQQRASANRGSVKVMSFDRLRPQYEARWDFTATVRRGKFVALAAQPTFELTSAHAVELLALDRKEAALQACEGIPPARLAWLLEAISQMDSWLRADRPLPLLKTVEERP